MKLLIVDDNLENLDLLRIELGAEGHAVTPTVNGVEALRALERERFDGVISDLLMPEMDGLRLCHEIRTSARLKSLPVVLYTAAYVTPSDRALAKEMGADDCLSQPAPTAVLIDALHAALRRGDRQWPALAAHAAADVLKSFSAALVRKLEKRNIELGDAHELLRDLFDHARDPIQALRPDGRFLYVNRAWHELLGYDAAELPDLRVHDVIAPESRPACQEVLDRLLRGLPVQDFELLLRTKDGRDLPAQGNATPRIVDGKVVSIRCTWSNLSQRKAAEAAQRASEQRLAGVVNTSMDAIITVTGDQKISHFNRAAERMFGRSADEVIGTGLASLLPERFRAGHEEHVAGFGRTGVTARQMGASSALTGLRRDGSEFPAEVSISHMEMGGGLYYTAILRDITERRNHEDRIARLSRVQTVLSGITSAIVRIREPQALFDEACRIAHEDGGFPIAWVGTYDSISGEVTPVAWRGLEGESTVYKATARGDLPAGRGLVGRAIRSRKPAFTNDLLADDTGGGPRRADARARGLLSLIVLPLVVDDEVRGVLALFATAKDFFSGDEIKLLEELAGDVSFALSYTAHQRRVEYLAYYDGLTGLPNRALFIERLGQTLRTAAQNRSMVAVAIGDIDHFRRINEVFSRSAGDGLLRQVGAHLRELSAQPENCARIAADAFGTFMTGAQTPMEVAHRVERSLTAVSESVFGSQGNELRVTMKAGIAIAPGDGDDAERLVSHAESALKNAKRSGERYLFYQPEMSARTADTLRVENKLRRALDREQFELHYHPEIDAGTGKVVALEALLRWNDPDAGIVPPGDFIGILETTGMIVDVGRWVIGRALTQARQWRSEGIEPPRMAVNVSPRQLSDRGFVETVTQLLTEHSDERTLLDFEITEGMIIEDFAGTSAKLRDFRRMGIGISIDDFGTGYSSLAYLGRLPVTALKIDRSFVASMLSSTDSMTIVTMIISLARSMNLVVIAEGVETQAQADQLRLLDCTWLQGYLFSKPLPADQVETFLSDNARST